MLAAAFAVGLFAGTGMLASPAGVGGAVTLGARVELGRFTALTFDLGYGLIDAHPGLQDRWWLMPQVAVRLPTGRVGVELAAGFGLATSSAFDSFGDLTHDHTQWDVQLQPAVRLSAGAATALSETVDLYVRADATLMLHEQTLARLADLTSFGLSVGLRFRVK